MGGELEVLRHVYSGILFLYVKSKRQIGQRVSQLNDFITFASYWSKLSWKTSLWGRSCVSAYLERPEYSENLLRNFSR